jgi:hypothetical protein
MTPRERDLTAALEDAELKIRNLIEVARNNGLANEYAEDDWTREIREVLKPAKIGITKIEIERAEGPSVGCRVPVDKRYELKTWAEANNVLKRISADMRDDPISKKYPGTYDKTDFKVTFEDGETYEGRADVTAGGEDTDLAAHIREFAKFHAGLFRPAHMSEADYARLVAEYEKDGTAKGFRDFLETYDLEETA